MGSLVNFGIAEEIAARVRNLPSLPAVIQRLIMVLEDWNCSTRDIERIVTADPALTARILKLANSPLYRGIEPVATISHAATRLGFVKLRDVAISIGTTANLTEMADEKTQQKYWHHALFTATCSHILAGMADFPVPEVAFVTGLLHDIGELVLAAVAPAETAQIQRFAPHERLDHEEEVFGATHPRVGHMLLKQWLLPKPLCDATRLHHTEKVFTSGREPVISVMVLADMLGKIHGLGSEPNCPAKTLFKLIDGIELEVGQIAQALSQVDARISDTRKHLEIAGDVSFLNLPRSTRGCNVAVVSADKAIVAWLQQLLSYHGHGTMSLQDYFASPEAADLVILDPQAATPLRLDNWRETLESSRSHLVVLDSGVDLAPGTLKGWDLPRVGLFLTPEEIRRNVEEPAGAVSS